MLLSTQGWSRRPRRHARLGWHVLALLVCCAGVLPAQRVRAAPVRASTPAAASPSAWLTMDADTRTARFVLRAGTRESTQPELNFNGAATGNLELRVPVGWTVEFAFANVGQTTHSARVVADVEVPMKLGAAAFAGAETPHGERGLPPGEQHTVRFRATRAGRYRVSCAVPAHGYAGMWVYFTVDPTLQQPDVQRHREAATGSGTK